MKTTSEKHTIEDLKKAITNRSLTDLEEIVENNPSLLNQNFAGGEDLISLATKTSLSSTQNDDKTKSIRILRKILQEKFKGFPQQAEIDLETLFLNKVLLEQLYAEKNTDVDFEIFKKAVLKTPDKSSSDNSFNKIYKQIFESINEAKEDDQKKPIKDADNNSMFIYSSGLINHQSYFIFHVDAQNKLTSISHCDGSSTENSKIKGSSTHIYGVTTFALENPVEYSSKFAQEFINENTKDKSIDEFNKKLENNAISKAKIDYTKTTYSIPTKAQKGENYTSKNTSILARFVANKKDPKMTFELDSKTKKPKGDGHNEYKKFKENLIKEASKSTLELQEETSKKSDNFSEYLKKEIKKTLDEAEKNNKRKLSLSNKSSSFLNLFSSQRLPDPRKIFHQELSEILSKKIQKEPEKTPPIEELNITQELQQKFPDFFPPEKQSISFASFRSKELPSIKENAKFIKEYHDLIAKKYKEIQSHNAKEGLVAKGIKEQDLFVELKKLDEKVEELLAKDSRKLNDELYKLSPDHYPQAAIIGRNALQSRKKSSKALSGAEFFKFSVLSNLIEVERKIKDVEEKNKKNEQPEQSKKIEEIEKDELVKTIQKIDESKELKFSAEDLQTFLYLERNKLDPSIKTSKEDPLLILKRVIDARKESLEKDTQKQDEKLFKNLLDLIEKEQERERERERKTSILKKLLRNFKKFSEAKDGSKTKFEKNYRENLVKFYEACPTKKERLDIIASFAPKLTITKDKLKIEFDKISLKEINILIKEKEEIKTTIPNNHLVLTDLLADYKDYKNKKEGNYNGDELIETLEQKYRNKLKEFKKNFPTEKEHLQIISSYAPSINLNKNQLQLEFYNICVQDKLAEIKELEDKIIADNSNEDLQKSKEDAKKNCKELQNKIFLLIRKNLSHSQSSISTQSSLLLGFIPLKDLSKLSKNIGEKAKEAIKFSEEFRKELRKPNANILGAITSVLISKTKELKS